MKCTSYGTLSCLLRVEGRVQYYNNLLLVHVELSQQVTTVHDDHPVPGDLDPLGKPRVEVELDNALTLQVEVEEASVVHHVVISLQRQTEWSQFDYFSL